MDKNGKPIRFILTGGEKSDYSQALLLIEDQQMGALLADKGYDAQYIAEKAICCGAKVVIPSRAWNKKQREYDKNLYKQRNLIERFYGKIKHYRRIATRYDKLANTFKSFIYFAAIFVWIE